MKKDAPIGVIDSGVGGLTILKALQEHMPGENFLYLGDTARAPYGVRPEAEIRAFIRDMLDWLQQQGIKQLVIACNTLTMLGVETLQPFYDFHIIGTSKGEKLLAEATKNKKVGVLATPFTINAGAHAKAVQALDAGIEVYGQACPKLVTLVETEKFGTEELRQAVREYTEPLKQEGVDAVILSCTHFPFLKEEIAAELGDGVVIIDPAVATSIEAKEDLRRSQLENAAAKGKITVCCTSDVEHMRRLTERMLPQVSCKYKLIKL